MGSSVLCSHFEIVRFWMWKHVPLQFFDSGLHMQASLYCDSHKVDIQLPLI